MSPIIKIFPRFLLPACSAFLMLAGISCTDDPPLQPPPSGVEEKFTLTLAEVGLTDATLRVSHRDSISSWTLALLRDGSAVRTLTVFGKDTLLTDTGLEPSRTYTYSAVRIVDTTVTEKSNDLRVTTGAPTSSAFQWRIDSLGGATSSTLYDVAILNDTLVYAVGEIYLKDSTGRIDPQAYGLAIWNGKKWRFRKLFVTYPGNPTRWFLRPQGILAFSASDIWLAETDIFHWDGKSEIVELHQVLGTVLPMEQRIRKLWGTSSTNIYGVGDNGAIVHYNGSTWRKIESGTRLPIRGLYGAMKEDGSGYEILCVANSYMEPEGSKVIKIENDKATTVWNDRRDFGLDDIWFIPGKRYIVVGDGFWETDSLSKPFRDIREFDVLNAAYKHTICGVNNKDIVVGGSFSLLVHFNGYKWTSFFPFTSGAAWGAKIKGDLIVAYGYAGRYAIAAIGRR